jgi:hypothetical protein
MSVSMGVSSASSYAYVQLNGYATTEAITATETTAAGMLITDNGSGWLEIWNYDDSWPHTYFAVTSGEYVLNANDSDLYIIAGRFQNASASQNAITSISFNCTNATFNLYGAS